MNHKTNYLAWSFDAFPEVATSQFIKRLSMFNLTLGPSRCTCAAFSFALPFSQS